MYIDGKLEGRASFPFCHDVKAGPLFVGAGCTMYPEPVAHAKLDEFALWDRPLDEAAVQALFAQGTAGKPLWEAPGQAAQAPSATGAGDLTIVRAQSPPPPTPNEPTVTHVGPRTTVFLNGWWQFLPSTDAPGVLPATGWGLARIPGYWTSPPDTLDPGGQPTNARWGGQPMSRYAIAHYQRTFVAAPAWRGRHVILRIGGVDGLAQVFVNGHSLGWLPGWEPEGHDITQRLNYGQENTVTIALRTRGGSEIAGIYGDVDLCLVPGPFINDLTVRPLVEKGQIAVDCGVYTGDASGAASLELDITPRATPDKVVRRFILPCRLTGSAATDTAAAIQHVSATLDWKDAHPWTIDDPFLYQVTAPLSVAGAVCDQSGPLSLWLPRVHPARG